MAIKLDLLNLVDPSQLRIFLIDSLKSRQAPAKQEVVVRQGDFIHALKIVSSFLFLSCRK